MVSPSTSMEEYAICSQVSWLDHFIEQKLYFPIMSSTDQVRLCGGDGFFVSLPAHFLLASSRLVKNIFLPGMAGQDVLIPSVKGSTLLLLVELLRSGMTSSLGLMDNIGCRLKEVQKVMELLEIPGCAALMRVNSSSSKLQGMVNCVQSSKMKGVKKCSLTKKFNPKEEESTSSLSPIVEMTGMKDTSKLSNENSFNVTEDSSCAKIKLEAEEGDFVGDASSSEGEMDQDVEGKENVHSIECHICNKKYLNRSSWSRHIKSVHRDVLFPCAQCGKKFILESNMKKHVRESHEGNRISCDHCQSTYNNNKNWRMHMIKNHKDKMYSCSDCGKCFVLESNLKHHVKSTHEGIQFQCDECPATFNRKVSLQVHVKNVHSGILLCCSYCPQTVSSKPNLNRHMKRFHHKELLLSCQNCDKQFEQDEDMKNHIQVCPNKISENASNI